MVWSSYKAKTNKSYGMLTMARQPQHCDHGMSTMCFPKMAPSIATGLQYPLCHQPAKTYHAPPILFYNILTCALCAFSYHTYLRIPVPLYRPANCRAYIACVNKQAQSAMCLTPPDCRSEPVSRPMQLEEPIQPQKHHN